MIDLTIRPSCPQLVAQLHEQRSGEIFGRTLESWRRETRETLGLRTDRPILATGHQAILWHPGIFAKYLLLDAVIRQGAGAIAGANLIVDQHVGGYADLEIPIVRADGITLASRTLALTNAPPEVPMGLHKSFTPPKPPSAAQLRSALLSVGDGVEQVCTAIYVHRDAPNAAVQMARALSDLMAPWVDPVPNVTAAMLMQTNLARAVIAEMADDPGRCAEAYNRAVRQVPAAGIGPLMIRDDYVELPIWRIRDQRRIRGYDNDAHDWLSDGEPVLYPRALLMTALMRLGMCDMFIHGTGGAVYDRAMELWLRDWLGVEPAPVAVATANLRLPLAEDAPAASDIERARHSYRHLFHNPEPEDKRAAVRQIDELPRGSRERRAAFFTMHERLADLRDQHADRIAAARDHLHALEIARDNAAIAARRDWTFILYPRAQLDELAAVIRGTVACAQPVRSALHPG